LTDNVLEVLDKIEAQRASRDAGDEPRNALDYLQDVYRGRRQAEPWRMRAAIAALQFESPKLSATAVMSSEDFGDRLERAILRSLGVRRELTNGDAG
jgi:hypothetical protein